MLMSFEQGGMPRVADFVHGTDGLGNINLLPPKARKIEKSAAQFLVDKVSEHPGEVSILALGPLTNLALVRLLSLLGCLRFTKYSRFHDTFIDCRQSRRIHPLLAKRKELWFLGALFLLLEM